MFRDALRSNPDLVQQYTGLKKMLTADPGMTRQAYAVRKTHFTITVLAKAGLDERALKEILDANV